MKKARTTTAKVLIVDDSESMVLTLKDILELQGINAVTALDGAAAVDRVDNDHSIKCVLMDIKMPGMNGVEALKKMKAARSGLEVIMMTAYAGSALAAKAVRSEARAVLNKPLDIKELIKMITDIVPTAAGG